MTPSRLFHRNTYEIHAVFDNAQGIRENAQVLYAGVYVGNVRKIRVEDGKAILVMDIKKVRSFLRMPGSPLIPAG